MRYYLVQHGKSYSKEEDPNRSLTDEGIEETQVIAKLLLEKFSRIDWVLHSGKKRAEQTASIFAKVLGLESKVKLIESINPTDDVMVFAKRMQKDTLIVSHLPFLEKLTNYLVVGNSEISSNVVDYKNSHVVCLEEDPKGIFQVVWIL